MKTSFLEKLILGNTVVDSQIDYSKRMTIGKLVLISIAITLFYWINDLRQGGIIAGSAWIFLPFIAVYLSVFYLLRTNKYILGANVMLYAACVLVYLRASSQPAYTGSSLFYVTIIVMGFALFGFERKMHSFILFCFALIMFLLARLVDFSILPVRIYSERVYTFNTIINISLAIVGIVFSVYLLLEHHRIVVGERDKANENLRKANAELDRFIYGVSHDLKSPIAGLIGLIDMVKSTQDNIEQYTDIMHNQLRKLNAFIEEITDYYRYSKSEAVITSVNVNAMVSEIWDILKFLPKAEKIELIMDIPPATNINTDINRLKNILGNLMSNAVRYHDDAKEKQYIKIKVEPRNNTCKLVVEDNGQGINKEYKEKVFDMFYRANTTSEGSGLGLFIVKESVEMLGGSIKLLSEQGQGTTFLIEIPA